MRVLSPDRSLGRLVAAVMLVAVTLAACAPNALRPADHPPTTLLQPPAAPGTTVASRLNLISGPLPFPFEENHGQAPADVAYLLRLGGLRATFNATGVSYRL